MLKKQLAPVKLPQLATRTVNKISDDSVLAVDFPEKRYLLDSAGYRMMSRDIDDAPLVGDNCEYKYCVDLTKRDTVTLDQLARGISLHLPDRTVIIDKDGMHNVFNATQPSKRDSIPGAPQATPTGRPHEVVDGCSFEYCIKWDKRDAAPAPAGPQATATPTGRPHEVVDGCTFKYCISWNKLKRNLAPSKAQTTATPTGRPHEVVDGCSFEYCIKWDKRDSDSY